METGVRPGDVEWEEDLEMVIIAGCAVLDVDDLNGNYDDDNADGDNDRSTGAEIGPANLVFPGEVWAKTGPKILLGYNYIAPGDGEISNSATADLIKNFVSRLPHSMNKGIQQVCELWIDLNLAKATYHPNWAYTNACAIFEVNGSYYYMYYHKNGPLTGVRIVEITQ